MSDSVLLPEGSQESQGPQNTLVEKAAEPSTAAIIDYGPKLPEVKSLVLVFASAQALGYSYAGILSQFTNQQMNLSGIVSTEMGALVSLLFLVSKTGYQFEWYLQQLKEDFFVSEQTFVSFFQKESPSNRLKKFIDNLQNKNAPFLFPLYIGCLGEVKTFYNQTAGLKECLLDSFKEPYPTEELLVFAHHLLMTQLVGVSFRGGLTLQTDFVIDVNIGADLQKDYQKKQDFIFNGKMASQKVIEQIKSQLSNSLNH